MLLCLQPMKFCLRTGFGESEELYGGSLLDRTMGLGQGNTAGPSGFSCLASLAVNAYRRQGHGGKLTSTYMARVFILAAVMFVNDTYLLHRPPMAETSDTDMISHTQVVTMEWVFSRLLLMI